MNGGLTYHWWMHKDQRTLCGLKLIDLPRMHYWTDDKERAQKVNCAGCLAERNRRAAAAKGEA
jgi:hypothetical protein